VGENLISNVSGNDIRNKPTSGSGEPFGKDVSSQNTDDLLSSLKKIADQAINLSASNPLNQVQQTTGPQPASADTTNVAGAANIEPGRFSTLC
jgi:hypothetical protein